MARTVVEKLEVGDEVLRFPICRNTETMGAVSVDRWWMDTTQLYGQRLRGRDPARISSMRGAPQKR